MGVAIGDYDRNGTMDIFKTNFAGDTSTLYANTGKGLCEDRTFAAGFGLNTRWLGWGVSFLDLDNDGWQDLFLVNGHVYPEVRQLKTEAGYEQRKVVYRNLRNGRFGDVSEQLGAPVTTPKAGRGAAFADFDNDGDVDIVVNNLHDTPDLFRLDQTGERHWVTLKLVGTQSNRSAIGSRCGSSPPTASSGRKFAAAAATIPRTIFGCISASGLREGSNASSCAGRMAAKRPGPQSPSIARTRSPRGRARSKA